MSRVLPPPTRFTDAEKINPFHVPIDLHDQALDHAPVPSRDDALAELALAAAVVARWSRWHAGHDPRRAASRGHVADVAAATGLDVPEVVRRWARWTEVQTKLVVAGRSSVDRTRSGPSARGCGRR